MLRLGDLGTVPDLVADFLLVLFPVANAAAAEEHDGNDDEEEEDDDDGHGDDAWSVGGWRGREAGERRCGQGEAQLWRWWLFQVHSENGCFLECFTVSVTTVSI